MAYSVKSKKNGTEYFLHGRGAANGKTTLYFFSKEVKDGALGRPAGRLRSLGELSDRPANPEKESRSRRLVSYSPPALIAAARLLFAIRQENAVGGFSVLTRRPSMQHQIHGTTFRHWKLILQPGEMVFSQTHQMAWMDDGITMDTNTGGGMLKGLMRSASGGSLFVTHFSAQSDCPSLVAFCPRFPGTIIARQLAPGETLICRKETFLCAESIGAA